MLLEGTSPIHDLAKSRGGTKKRATADPEALDFLFFLDLQEWRFQGTQQ